MHYDRRCPFGIMIHEALEFIACSAEEAAQLARHRTL